MNLGKVYKGLAIIYKYTGDDGDIAAGHDEIYAGGDEAQPHLMSDEDVQELDDLGWMYDEDFESWLRFV